jgi:CRP/FNR family transcriptional regulator, cyclic AMP receptor protein
MNNLSATGQGQGFWGLLSEAERAALSAIGLARVYPPGATLVVEGDPSTHVFILIEGQVKVMSSTSDGQQLTLALRGYGDVVGEIAGATTGRRNATIQAIDMVRSLIVGYDRFGAFLDSSPNAAYAYRRTLTKLWNDADSVLRSRPVTTGAQRLAELLLKLADRHGIAEGGEIHVTISLSQEEWASLAGTSRATVTRILSNWRRRGIIRTGQRQITIIDRQALQQITRPID